MKTDLNLLRVLVAIYETGSVTAAAARLKMSQPAASAALSRLRASLGDALFVRRGSRMEATPRAQGLIARTREVIQVIDNEILPNPVFDPATFAGELSFCMSEIGEVVFLPRLHQHLQREAPQASVRTVGLPPHELEQALHDGRVDAVVGYYPDLDSHAVFQQRLYSHDVTCIVRRGHPIKASRFSLRQFVANAHILVRDGGRNQEMFEQELAARGIVRNVALRTSHYMSLPHLIIAGDALAVLPRALAELFVASASVRIVEPPFASQKYELKQYWHRRYGDDAKGMWLRGLIARLFIDSA